MFNVVHRSRVREDERERGPHVRHFIIHQGRALPGREHQHAQGGHDYRGNYS